MCGLHFIFAPNYESFERVRFLVDRCVNKATHGEFTSTDLKNLIRDKYAYGVYVVNEEGEIDLVMIWELVCYPRKTAVNVIALAGCKSEYYWKHYGKTMMNLWRSQGASEVTCYASKAMERLANRYGLTEQYRFLNMRIEDEKRNG